MSREAMQMALDMLNEIADDVYCDQKLEGVIAALRQALETEQEPVAWLSTDCIGERYLCFTKPKDNDPVQPLHTTPPKREWVGLTDEEIVAATNAVHGFGAIKQKDMNFAKAIEAKLREKNHG